MIFIVNVLLSFYLKRSKDGVNRLLLFLEITFLLFHSYDIYPGGNPAIFKTSKIISWVTGRMPELFFILDVTAVLLHFRKRGTLTILCLLGEILLPLAPLVIEYFAIVGDGWFSIFLVGIVLNPMTIPLLKPPLILLHFFYLLYGTYRQFVSRRKKGEA
ncbi:MAG: hypothetical protein LBI29_00370 [Rickettsiales bacterium]|jgi:hypothetical protein|nr:hypothetical protein [Rickettsiales bacterium]